jgi:putative spermidine/putrescine transport system substrate-binding protein
MKRLFSLSFMIMAWLTIIAAPALTQETTITVCSYGGTYNKGFEDTIGKPFTEATGIKVIFTTFPTYAQMKAQVMTKNIEWDVVEVECRMLSRGSREGLFEPLDLSKISSKDFAEGTLTKFGMGLVSYSWNISYNTNKWAAGTGPNSMVDFWDTAKFPGPRTLKLGAFSNLEAAILAAGVPANKIYPIDVKLAFKKLDELKPNIQVFWKSGGQSQQVMREKEADVGYNPGGRMMQIAEEGAPITWIWKDNMQVLDSLVILKGTKKYDAAMKFIAFASEPKQQAAFGEWTNYGPANMKAFEHIKPEKAKLMPTYPENRAIGGVVDGDWYAEHEEEVERMYEAWRMK